VPGDRPELPRRGPAPAVEEMSNAELGSMIASEHPYRAKALFELCERVPHDDDAATKVAMLSRLTSLRTARVFDPVSLAWSAIIALLAAGTGYAREQAYEAFGALDPDERNRMLKYLEASSIEDARPSIS
jgi:hypothetical protein